MFWGGAECCRCVLSGGVSDRHNIIFGRVDQLLARIPKFQTYFSDIVLRIGSPAIRGGRPRLSDLPRLRRRLTVSVWNQDLRLTSGLDDERK
eukprot:1412889-Pyramimonas_sp.AAC.1